MKLFEKRAAFTLIELLIVVAIIAILAAIAVPNFLEAQTRSKVSRCKADMRSITTALEAYYVDYNRYPNDPTFLQFETTITFNNSAERIAEAFSALTTPVAFMTSIPPNVFPNETDNPGVPKDTLYRYFGKYWRDLQLFGNAGNPLYPAEAPYLWSLASSGPDRQSNLGEYLIFGLDTFDAKFPMGFPAFDAGPTCLYDPTNGTISAGDIVRVGPGGPQY